MVREGICKVKSVQMGLGMANGPVQLGADGAEDLVGM